MRRPPLDSVPGLTRPGLVAEVASQASPDELASSASPASLAELARLVELASQASETRAAAFYLTPEASELVGWLQRHLPGDGAAPTRSQVAEVCIRLTAEVLRNLLGG